MAEDDEFGARTAGEVVEVDAAVDSALGAADGGPHGVDPTRCVTIRIHDSPCELNELEIVRGWFSTGD